MPWIVRVAFAAFMMPPLVFAITWGNFPVYRASQITALAFMAVAAFVVKSGEARAPSWQALVIATVVGVTTIAAVVQDAFTGRPTDAGLLMKAAMVIGFVLSLDRLRGHGFAVFARAMVPLSVVIVAATAVHFAVNPVIVWGRYMFFGTHPNLGGEVLFACMITLVFARSRLLRLGLGGVIIVLLMLLQSRAALGGALIVLVGSEAFRLFVLQKARAASLVAGLVLVAAGGLGAVMVLAMPESPVQAASYIANTIFLLDDPNRGLGTGFVGRDETWGLALAAFAENPVFGAGMDRTGRTADGLAVHSGYLGALGQFGILSLGLYLVLVSSLLRAIRQRNVLSIIIAASLFIFLFNARVINLNIFPFLMWIACLPWAPNLPSANEGPKQKPVTA